MNPRKFKILVLASRYQAGVDMKVLEFDTREEADVAVKRLEKSEWSSTNGVIVPLY